MLTSLSLRLRIFLIFFGVAVLMAATVSASLVAGYARIGSGIWLNGFIFAGILSSFGILAVTAGIWFLFDENVAKPIQRLAANMRTRAHAGGTEDLDLHETRYLGDLAPAVREVARRLTRRRVESEQIVAEETARIKAEKAQLAELLSHIPIAVILVNQAHQITLYDGQAAEILGQVHVPRLNASIFDYFDEETLRAAHAQLSPDHPEIEIELGGARGNLGFSAKLSYLATAPGYMVTVDAAKARITPEAARPLIYDFDLSEHAGEHALEDRTLASLNFVVFDTETTGLMPAKDEIVQIGAVRVVNGRIVAGETVDQLVHPGRPIPPASTKVHGVCDAMVADAPDAPTAVSQFHGFARDSVIVAHNAPFDMAFLRRHGKSLGQAWDHPILDTVLLSAVLFGSNEVHTLDALCERLEITIPEELRHTALGDARATAEALCLMLPMLESHGFSSFGAVIQETRKHGRLLKDLN